MKKNAVGIIGTFLLLLGFVLLGMMFYTLYDSFMNGNIFEHDPLVFFAEFVGSILALGIGGELLNRYHY